MPSGISKVSVLLALSAGLSNAIVLPELFQEAFKVEDYQQVQDLKESYMNVPWHHHVPYFLKPLINTDKLQESIKLEDLNATAWDLYHIAETSEKKYGHPTRVIGSKGHKNTIDYILSEFDKMKDYYDVSLQTFKALTGKINSFNLTDSATWDSFDNTTAFTLSPPVRPFFGRLVEIPNLGCDEADFKSVESHSMTENHKKSGDKNKKSKKINKDDSEKKIALIGRGSCPFGTKSDLAGKYGYHAVVVYDNDPDAQGIHATLGAPTKHTVSTIGVTYSAGKHLINSLKKNQYYSLYFAMDSFVKNIKTKNIIADTKHGDPENIVGLGAHSDSVEEGPGINDDGSGTISLLTVAKQLTHFKINNKVRFAWWSAEEEGLLGSNYYANHLDMEENMKLRVFMDYDMMASPNYEYEVYDANNIDNPKGSEELKKLYIDYYTAKGLNYTLIPFDGRSDYVGFIENGIPAGGIAAGAEKKNVFNGDVLDICYHQLCDDISNLAWDAFLFNTQLIAHSVATYAKSFEGFPVRENVTSTLSATSKKNQAPLFKYRADKLIM